MSEEFRLENTLKKIDYSLKCVGVPLDKEKDGKFHKFTFVCLIVDLAGAFGWFFVGAMNSESLTTLTYNAPCLTICTLANTKSLCFIIYNKQVKKLISTLKHLENAENLRPKSQKKTEAIEKEIKFLQNVLKVLNFFNWILLLTFSLMPLSLTVMDYVTKKEWNPVLPLLVLYPFDEYDIRVYPFVFLRQIWSIASVLLTIGGTDFTFFVCSTYLKVQFQLLAAEVEGLITGTSDTQNLSEDGSLKAKIKDVVTWHQQLMYAVDLMETIYSQSTVVNFVTSSLIICLTGFNATTIEDKAYVISFLSFFVMSVLQIFFLCFFGDMIVSASGDVSYAAYNSKWYCANKKTAKMLLIILTRAQKPCTLTAWGFADVNLMAFTKILSTAWSYFALLQTVYSSKQN